MNQDNNQDQNNNQNSDSTKSNEDILAGLFGEEGTTTTPTTPTTPENKEDKPDEATEKIAQAASKAAQEAAENASKRVEQVASRASEVITYLTSDTGSMYKEYTNEIRRVALDPRFINLPIERVIGLALTPEKIIKIAQKVKSDADSEAAKGNLSGGNNRPDNAPGNTQYPDFKNMSTDEFNKYKQSVLTGQVK